MNIEIWARGSQKKIKLCLRLYSSTVWEIDCDETSPDPFILINEIFKSSLTWKSVVSMNSISEIRFTWLSVIYIVTFSLETFEAFLAILTATFFRSNSAFRLFVWNRIVGGKVRYSVDAFQESLRFRFFEYDTTKISSKLDFLRRKGMFEDSNLMIWIIGKKKQQKS